MSEVAKKSVVLEKSGQTDMGLRKWLPLGCWGHHSFCMHHSFVSMVLRKPWCHFLEL